MAAYLNFAAVLATVACGVATQVPEAICADQLRLVGSIALPRVEGRIDHMVLDVEGQRLFVAALGNNTVEVIDLSTQKVVRSIRGLREPQGMAYLEENGTIAVANGDDGKVRLFDGATFRSTAVFDFQSDADNLRYDPTSRRLYVGFGDGAIGVNDAAARNRLSDIKLSAHPESFQLETKGTRIYVNVPNADQVAVIDRKRSTVVATWVLKGVANFPMALDESNHRLFIGCREPAELLVLDTNTGKTVQSLAVAGDTDDVFYDGDGKRIYISGGQGAVTIISQKDVNTYSAIGRVPTAPGARTSLFAPKSRMLYVAVPHRGKREAAVLVFKAQ
jgi:YVTN family beta-propeller protein